MIQAVQFERQNIARQRHEAYEYWEQEQLSDPRLAGVRMLTDDLRDFGEISAQTWERFDVEERTWAAEVLNAPHSHVDRFRFDGQDIIVKEADGVNPVVTLRQVYERGLEKARTDAEADPGVAYQVRRDELFLRFYEQIEQMMRGQTTHDTIHMISTCPVPAELSDDPDEARRRMKAKFYDPDRRKSFDYTARRLPNGQLELSATTLDSSDLSAHAAVLRATGHENVSFALSQSHEYGKFLSFDNTTSVPIELVIAARTSIYDEALSAKTGKTYRNGREDDTIDAHEFFDTHCQDYWAGYKAYHELLARHLAGQPLERPLQKYLLRCLEKQQRVEQTVLKDEQELVRLRQQLWHGKVTLDMAMSCRALLVYDHRATLAAQLKKFIETGTVDQLKDASGDFMNAYADAASSNGAAAAAAGETFAGCETAIGVTSLAQAAQSAAANGVSLEQSLYAQQEEAMHCLRIQLQGYTIRENVTCPFCNKKVNARDTQASIECLDEDCGVVLDKATGRAHFPDRKEAVENAAVESPVVRLRSGQDYRVGEAIYRREQMLVVGGAKIVYTDSYGQRLEGVQAEQLDAIISQQLAEKIQAA